MMMQWVVMLSNALHAGFMFSAFFRFVKCIIFIMYNVQLIVICGGVIKMENPTVTINCSPKISAILPFVLDVSFLNSASWGQSV